MYHTPQDALTVWYDTESEVSVRGVLDPVKSHLYCKSQKC